MLMQSVRLARNRVFTIERGSEVKPVTGTYLVLGNWKMHLTLQEAATLAKASASAIGAAQQDAVTVGVAPAFPQLSAVRQATENTALLVGGQDCHPSEQGAFTGDVSAPMLRDAGCDFTIVGHSERRHGHKESDALVAQKAEAALGQGLHVVLCVGETLEQHEGGQSRQAVEQQLRASLPADFDRNRLTVSYEPVWAIGTGKTAEKEDISEMHAHIRAVIQSLQKSGDTPRVLYGGSVKANNALDILSLPVVDGVLVGGASLDAQAFKAIIEAAERSALNR